MSSSDAVALGVQDSAATQSNNKFDDNTLDDIFNTDSDKDESDTKRYTNNNNQAITIHSTYILPEGWQTICKKRRRGITKGRINRYWIAPDGTRFNSMRSVRIALKKAKPA